MGMFDNVWVEYQLPDGAPSYAQGAEYQTKDLECTLAVYTITKNGELMLDGQPVYYHGELNIYASNAVASGGGGTYTRDGSDHYWLSYLFTFTQGKVQSVKLLEHREQPALPSSELSSSIFWRQPAPTPEETRARKERIAESMLGKDVYMRGPFRLFDEQERTWESAHVVYEDENELVVKRNKALEILRRDFRDRQFFDSPEDGKKYDQEQIDRGEKAKQEFQDKIAARKKAQA